MLINRESLMQLYEVLAVNENLKATVGGATKGALITGVGALFGGLFGGPVGLAIGGTISSVYAAYTSEGYKPVIDILRNNLTQEQKRILTEAARKILSDIRAQDIISLIVFVSSSEHYKQLILKELGAFLINEMGMVMIGQ